MQNPSFLTLPRLLVTLILSFTALPGMADDVLMDAVVARVNREPILLSDLQQIQQSYAQQPQLQQLGGPMDLEGILDQVINQKILLVQAHKDSTITVSEEEVNQRLEPYMQNAIQQYGGQEQLEKVLSQQQGMTFSEFKSLQKEQLHERLLIHKLQTKYVGQFTPTRRQVQQFYNEYKDSIPKLQNAVKVAHIQWKIKPDVKKETRAKQRIDSVIAKLESGESFSELAGQFSDDPTGEDGGDLGYTKKGTLDPDYEKAAFRLEMGEYTKIPVRSRIGYHVIRLTGKKDNSIRTSHILALVKPTEDDAITARNKLDSLREIAIKNSNFEQLAKKHSQDRKTASKGGVLGWFEKDKLEEQYKGVIDTLAEGEISAPVKIEDSYHIFQLVSQQDERQITLDENWDQVSEMAKSYYSGQQLNDHIDRWRERVHVEKHLAQYMDAVDDSGR